MYYYLALLYLFFALLIYLKIKLDNMDRRKELLNEQKEKDFKAKINACNLYIKKG